MNAIERLIDLALSDPTGSVLHSAAAPAQAELASLRAQLEQHRTCPECNHKMIPADCPVEAQLALARHDWQELKALYETARQGIEWVNRELIGAKQEVLAYHEAAGLLKVENASLRSDRDKALRVAEELRVQVEASRWCAKVADNEKRDRLAAESDRDKALRVAEELRRELTHWNSGLVADSIASQAERNDLRGLVDEMAEWVQNAPCDKPCIHGTRIDNLTMKRIPCARCEAKKDILDRHASIKKTHA